MTGKELGLKTVKGQILRTKEIAAFLRVSIRWVQVHMKDGTFPVPWYSIGYKERGCDSADLDEYLRKIKVEAGESILPVKAKRKIKKRKEVVA